MAAAGFAKASHASVQARSSYQKARLWAPGHGRCITKLVGSDLMEYDQKIKFYTGVWPRPLNNLKEKILHDLGQF